MFRNKPFISMILLSGLLILAAFCLTFVFPGCMRLMMVGLGVALVLVFGIYTGVRYIKIRQIAYDIHDFQRGKKRLDLESYEEGELSYLCSEVDKLCVKLTEQAQLLKADKKYLANAISDISHQLKTPLTSMSMMADFLKDDGLSEEKRCEFAGNIQIQLSRIEWLVSALLKMARLDAGTVQLKQNKVPVKKMIKKASAHLLIPMELKNQQLVIECDENCIIECDLDWTSEALANILKNCIEHMDSGKILKVSVSDNSLYILITIQDQGCGICSEDLPHIFERFYKGRNSASESVGIGLAMARQIIHEQNGDIGVESVVGQGTTFTVKFYKNNI